MMKHLKVLILLFFSVPAFALDLEWTGRFKTESHMLFNYTMAGVGLTPDTTKLSDEGYYVPAGGNRNAYFQTLFLDLKPIVVVNDNIYLKSEWHVGSPAYGFFGNAAKPSDDGRAFYTTQSAGTAIVAQRYWGEFLSEIGVIQVGRAPLHWGLGVVWDSGDDLADRFQSTGDMIRVVSKFGSFTFIPAIITYSMGNAVGGSCLNPTATATGAVCSSANVGHGSLTDYSIAFRYQNLDDDVEMGLNFVKRIAGASQDPNAGILGPTGDVAGSNYNTWDIYGKKRLGPFSFGIELPIVTGDLAGANYRSYALALEAGWRISDPWEMSLKAGHAPGQPDSSTVPPGVFEAIHFHPNYKLGLILFNYQFRNFVGPNSQNNAGTSSAQLKSPFDNSIVDASYLAWTGRYHTNKWHFHTTFIWAQADEAAGSGSHFYNYWTRRFVAKQTNRDQSKYLGWEMDYGTQFDWDEAFKFNFDFGFFFPGDFYKFTNSADEDPLSMVFALNFRVGVAF